MKAILLVRPGGINDRDRVNLLAEGVLAVEYRDATEPKLVPLAGDSDIGSAITDLITGLVERLPTDYRVRTRGEVVVEPCWRVMGGGGPPVVSDGVPVPGVPDAGPFVFYNRSSKASQWLFIAAASVPPPLFTPSPSNMLTSDISSQLPTVDPALKIAGLGSNPIGKAYKLLPGESVTVSWAPGLVKPVIWTP